MVHPKQLLLQHGLDPKKSLGQNFLFDEHLLRQIVDAAAVHSGDAVLEVGPGLGSMTVPLANKAGKLVAVELDQRLIPILRLQLGRFPHVQLVHQDILEFDPTDYFESESTYKVVANVPYYITGAILRHLLSHAVRPDVMVLTVQKDVATRLVAKPPDMSLLAVSVQFYGVTTIIMDLAAGSFWPQPKVASAVVKIDLTQRLTELAEVNDEKRFFDIVRAGFSQRRKQLHNNLRQLGFEREDVQAKLRSAEIDGRRRAETLSMLEWLSIYRAFTGTAATQNNQA